MFVKEQKEQPENLKQDSLRTHTRLAVSSVYDTVKEMRRLILESANDPTIRYLAEEIVKDETGRDYNAEIQAVFTYCQYAIRYTHDINDIETLKNPSLIAQEIESRGMSFGDCDDYTVFTASLLNSIGYRTRIVIMKSLWNQDGTFNHVYLEVLRPDTNAWVPVDCTAGKSYGFMPEAKEKEYFNV